MAGPTVATSIICCRVSQQKSPMHCSYALKVNICQSMCIIACTSRRMEQLCPLQQRSWPLFDLALMHCCLTTTSHIVLHLKSLRFLYLKLITEHHTYSLNVNTSIIILNSLTFVWCYI